MNAPWVKIVIIIMLAFLDQEINKNAAKFAKKTQLDLVLG